MLKLNTILLIVGILFLSSFLHAQFMEGYEPLTSEEAERYIKNIGLAFLIEDIIKLDMLEHSVALVKMPDYAALLNDKNELLLFPVKPFLEIDVVYLKYRAELSTYLIKDFLPEQTKDDYVKCGFIGGLSGLAVAFVNSKEWYMWVLGTGIGVGMGLIFEYIF